MKANALLFTPVVCLALFAFTFAACSDEDAATPAVATDAAAADAATPTPDGGGGTDSGGNVPDAQADADADAATGPTISQDPLAPTPLTVGQSVTANLAANAENFFEFTTGAAGNYTLNFTAPGDLFYASFALVKEAHGCGLPSCVQGTGTAPLPGLEAATKYYLNLYNGTVAAASYTISVTSP